MRLPQGNSLTLAGSNDQLVVDDSDPPAPDLPSVLALCPAWVRSASSAVRDPILCALSAQVNGAWARIGQSMAAQRSPRNASGIWLEAWGAHYRRPRAARESDGAWRARLLTPPDVVSPNAIRAAVEAVVLPATSPAGPVLLEPSVDAMFVSPVANAEWCCFVQPTATRLWGADPVRPGHAWGAYAVPAVGAFFIVVLPLPNDEGEPSPYAELAPGVDEAASFVAADDADLPFAFTFEVGESLIERVVSEVEPRHGAGVAWMVFNDPFAAVAA